jgi:signal transduction histidine kinase
MIAAVVVIGALLVGTVNTPSRLPAQEAQGIATAVAGLVEHDQRPQLDVVLHALVDGDLRAVAAFGAGGDRGPQAVGFGLSDVAYVVLLDPSGQPIASSDTAGAAFAPPERDSWPSLASGASTAGRTTGSGVVPGPPGGPVAFGVAAITGSSGQPLGTVIVANSTLPPRNEPNLLGVLAIFGAATLAVLVASSLFALASSSLVAYLLSRRLVARLERLSRAVAQLRAGNLAARVAVQGQDEVGQLQVAFNAMAADLEAERDRVTGLLEAQRQLVASVSHELRTPVAIVRGYLESALQRERTVAPDLHADLQTMEQELDRLQRRIDDLFTLSRAEVGGLGLRLAPVDVGRVAQGVVDTIAPLAWRQGRVEVVAEIGSHLPPAEADADRLAQIVSNLLNNATRHTPPGGLVAVAVSAEPECIRLEVRDTGEGISAADLPHVFERFFTGTASAGARHDGAGLGLALVKELTTGMGGRVEASSEPGEGSVFTVRLPLAAVPTVPVS